MSWGHSFKLKVEFECVMLVSFTKALHSWTTRGRNPRRA